MEWKQNTNILQHKYIENVNSEIPENRLCGLYKYERVKKKRWRKICTNGRKLAAVRNDNTERGGGWEEEEGERRRRVRGGGGGGWEEEEEGERRRMVERSERSSTKAIFSSITILLYYAVTNFYSFFFTGEGSQPRCVYTYGSIFFYHSRFFSLSLLNYLRIFFVLWMHVCMYISSFTLVFSLVHRCLTMSHVYMFPFSSIFHCFPSTSFGLLLFAVRAAAAASGFQ